ncbi:MAG: DNA methyltransferase [Promethearchaeota archaeon]
MKRCIKEKLMAQNDYTGIKEYNLFIEEEHYPRYQRIWQDLLVGDLKSSFKLEFEKKFNAALYNDEFYSTTYPRTIENGIKLLKSVGWRNDPYDRQHWGNWLHSLSPYQGRMTPSLAHWLIKIFSKKGDFILDPFMGVGTVPLEADFLQRNAIGVDLNTYGFTIAKGKFERKSIDYYLNYLREIGHIERSLIDISSVSDWIQAYFHPETLKEIIFLNEKLKNEKEYFLLSCLMGILHGNRPGYLSVWTGCIIPMTPRPKTHPKFRPDKDKPEYRAVIPRMAAKVMRMFSTGFPLLKKNTKIILGDARNLNLKDNSVDVVICSPPYYNTLDYVGQNRVRLYFLGLNKVMQDKLRKELIQDTKTYLDNMREVGKELKRVLKDGLLLVYVLGDVHRAKYSINTAKKVSELYQQLDFKELAIVNDEIPLNKIASRSKRRKFDRILVLKNG